MRWNWNINLIFNVAVFRDIAFKQNGGRSKQNSDLSWQILLVSGLKKLYALEKKHLRQRLNIFYNFIKVRLMSNDHYYLHKQYFKAYWCTSTFLCGVLLVLQNRIPRRSEDLKYQDIEINNLCATCCVINESLQINSE